MKPGDMVNWRTNSWVMDRPEYRNRSPGIITDRLARAKYEVFWSNGSITIEHHSYLEVISESR